MKSIEMISEFVHGKITGPHGTHYTVYYKSGRRFDYYGDDTLPMSVVNFLTSESVVSETRYINDTYWGCINKETTYKAAV